MDGNNIITTITDNGGGDHNGLPVICVNLGLDALDALPLAGLDPDEIDVADVLDMGLWGGTLWMTTAEDPEIVVSANDNLANDWDELPAGAYASVGACLAADLETGDMELASMDYEAPIFVPGGFGSIGQALDLGSSALSAEGGSSNLLNAGSDMMGS